ncbi:MAG: isochorismatase family cysteine hydrolase [Pseudomonadota bacterium]
MDWDLETMAFLVMDYQNDIMHVQGALGRHGMGETTARSGATERTADVLERLRTAGAFIVHVGVGYRAGHPELDKAEKFLGSMAKANALVEGTWGVAFAHEVAPRDGELVIIKRGMSSFTGTDLERVLRQNGIETVVLAGIATTFVVEGTARHAVDLGFNVVTIHDCCASFNVEMHAASINVLKLFGPCIGAAELNVPPP